MRVVLQKVSNAQVSIAGEVVGKIGKGYMLLVGFAPNDGDAELDYLVHKIVNLRVFEDENGKMNRGLKDVDGGILSVSQFTLYADLSSGNRPSFVKALPGSQSEPLFGLFAKKMDERMPGKIEKGVFGADMKVHLINDGPFTVLLDSKELWG